MISGNGLKIPTIERSLEAYTSILNKREIK